MAHERARTSGDGDRGERGKVPGGELHSLLSEGVRASSAPHVGQAMTFLGSGKTSIGTELDRSSSNGRGMAATLRTMRSILSATVRPHEQKRLSIFRLPAAAASPPVLAFAGPRSVAEGTQNGHGPRPPRLPLEWEAASVPMKGRMDTATASRLSSASVDALGVLRSHPVPPSRRRGPCSDLR